MSKKIYDWINKKHKKGYKLSILKKELLDVGHEEKEVDLIIKKFNKKRKIKKILLASLLVVILTSIFILYISSKNIIEHNNIEEQKPINELGEGTRAVFPHETRLIPLNQTFDNLFGSVVNFSKEISEDAQNIKKHAPEYQDMIDNYVKKIERVPQSKIYLERRGSYEGEGVVKIARELSDYNYSSVLIHEATHAMIDELRGGYSILIEKTTDSYFDIEVPAYSTQCLYGLKSGVYDNYYQMIYSCGRGSSARQHYNRLGCVERRNINDYDTIEEKLSFLKTISSCAERETRNFHPSPEEKFVESSSITIEKIPSDKSIIKNEYELLLLKPPVDTSFNVRFFEASEVFQDDIRKKFVYRLSDEKSIQDFWINELWKKNHFEKENITIYDVKSYELKDSFDFRITNSGSTRLHCSMIGIIAYSYLYPEINLLPLDCTYIEPGESVVFSEPLIDFNKVKIWLVGVSDEPEVFEIKNQTWVEVNPPDKFKKLAERNKKIFEQELIYTTLIISNKNKTRAYELYLDLEKEKIVSNEHKLSNKFNYTCLLNGVCTATGRADILELFTDEKRVYLRTKKDYVLDRQTIARTIRPNNQILVFNKTNLKFIERINLETGTYNSTQGGIEKTNLIPVITAKASDGTIYFTTRHERELFKQRNGVKEKLEEFKFQSRIQDFIALSEEDYGVIIRTRISKSIPLTEEEIEEGQKNGFNFAVACRTFEETTTCTRTITDKNITVIMNENNKAKNYTIEIDEPLEFSFLYVNEEQIILLTEQANKKEIYVINKLDESIVIYENTTEEFKAFYEKYVPETETSVSQYYHLGEQKRDNYSIISRKIILLHD